MSKCHMYALRQLTITGLLLLLLTTNASTRTSLVVQGETPKAIGSQARGAILKDVPEKPDLKAWYLFYLHGKLIEDKGANRPVDPKYGVYEYEEILKTFESKGFTVVSEPRAKGTDPEKYAAKVRDQVNSLLKAGVPPLQITVLGVSKGSIITMIASTLIKNRDVNYVIMSNCNDWVARTFNIDLYGNVLSIYDINDEFGHSCKQFFEKATGLNRRKEVELKVGTGHAILYKPMKEWVGLVVRWAQSRE